MVQAKLNNKLSNKRAGKTNKFWKTIKWKYNQIEWNKKIKNSINCKFFFFFLFDKFYLKKMSYIQLPYGYFKNNEQIQFNLPKN